ncbi:hypothetical protein [Pseudochryseolinea flava]|uniref:Sensor of ECF-type sigma factor n=1 Tax=Pseudochryseolinea flava TaxID=2059302 RepID=A0A364XYT9_9BACT|nr:hypothetical protein [Pseudochryseolinea flava]RAV99522.1 hypothetical protein DQQ10_18125 [Pseudochryseolinea flava]
MMKTLLKIFLLLVIALPAFAQEDDDVPQNADPKVKDKIEAARIAYLTDQLGLTPAEAEKFWPVYREFAEKRLDLKKQYRQAKRNPNPNVSTEENDKNLVDLGLKLKQQELDLEKDYSGRLMKVISAQKVRELPEAEKRFRSMILDQIQRRQMRQERNENMRDRSQQRLRQRNN